MKSTAPTQGTRRGFTLVELLVSITILSIMLLFLGQAMGFVSNIWVNGVGMVDNFSKARNILNILDRDVQGMVMRPDMSAFVDGNTPPNPACAFYTNVQGYSANTADTRAVSLVQYVMSTPGTLTRKNYGMNFSLPIAPAIPAIPGSLTSPNPLTQLSSVTAAGTETLATGVIEFQYQFVDGYGQILTPPYTYKPVGSATGTTTPFYYDYTSPTAPPNARAVVISLLVLNNSAYNLAKQTGQLANIKTIFETGTLPANQTYSQFWNGTLNPSSGTFGASLPAPIRSGLKVFQRYLPLPVPAP
jgi:prepilin-type N-terminal cleavage/methylation domain-containing protein